MVSAAKSQTCPELDKRMWSSQRDVNKAALEACLASYEAIEVHLFPHQKIALLMTGQDANGSRKIQHQTLQRATRRVPCNTDDDHQN